MFFNHAYKPLHDINKRFIAIEGELDASLAVPAHDPDLTLTRRIEGIKKVLENSRDDVTVMAYDVKDQYKVLSQVVII